MDGFELLKINHRILILAAILAINAGRSDAQVSVHYRETANIFEIMDNVSDWWPGFCHTIYREYWSYRIGFSR